MRSLLRLILCCISFFYPALSGAETASTWDVRQLMQELSQVKEAKGTFTESKHLQVLSHPLESSGTLLFKAPDHLEKHTVAPKAESLVLDKGVLRIDNKARNIKRTLQLQDYPALWALVESIRSTLAGDLETLQRFYTIELDGNSSGWTMTLQPIELKMREVVSEVRISGHANIIDSIETREANGDHALMKIRMDAP